jgi:hypothetical protein
MHSGGSHTTHITGSNAVDGDRAADGSAWQPPVAYRAHKAFIKWWLEADGSRLRCDRVWDELGHPAGLSDWIEAAFAEGFAQAFQNTRHDQSDPDRFSAPVCCFNHSQADSAGEARNNG